MRINKHRPSSQTVAIVLLVLFLSAQHPSPFCIKMPKTTPMKNRRSLTAAKKACTICGGHFRPQVFTSHVKKCEREKNEREGRLEYEKDLVDRAHAALAGNVVGPISYIDLRFVQGPSALRTAIGTPTLHEHSTTLESDTHPDVTGAL
jgi:hypothetical protein